MRGFRDGDIVLFRWHDSGVIQTLWLDPKSKTPIFRIAQQWEDGDEDTIYLHLHEIGKIAQVAHDYVFPPSVQEWEDYLGAQDRHDDAVRR